MPPLNCGQQDDAVYAKEIRVKRNIKQRQSREMP